MGQYKFSDFYKCGANCIVMVGQFPILEAAGIGLQIHESKLPIYGYSDRHFAAVGRGRVLVEGSLFINWVHQDYLFQAMDLANNASYGDYKPSTQLQKNNIPAVEQTFTASDQELSSFIESGLAQFASGDITLESVVQQLKQAYSANADVTGAGDTYAGTYNPHDSHTPVNLRVIAGQPTQTLPTGDWGFDITNVHFTGRGLRIQVSEEVIMEQYTFIARNVHTLKYSKIVSPSTISIPGYNPDSDTTPTVGDTPDQIINPSAQNIIQSQNVDREVNVDRMPQLNNLRDYRDPFSPIKFD